jgi:hypothetical protein
MFLALQLAIQEQECLKNQFTTNIFSSAPTSALPEPKNHRAEKLTE